MDLCFLQDAELAKYPMITGHTGYGLIHRLRPPVHSITFLRDPVARVVSQYRYFVGLANDPTLKPNQFARLMRGRTLEQLLLDHDEPFVQQYFCEMQTFSLHSNPFMYFRQEVRDLPRQAILEQAITHMEQLSVLGLVERLPQSIQRMCKYFGWESVPDLPHEMRSPDQTAIELSSSLIELIRERNPMDLALYEHAVRLFDAA